MKHWTAQDYIHDICESSAAGGQVKRYQLSEEERQAIIDKYGPPKLKTAKGPSVGGRQKRYDRMR